MNILLFGLFLFQEFLPVVNTVGQLNDDKKERGA
jgi:hypothetical protein